MSDEQQPSKLNANVNYYSGAAKESIGNLVGNESLKSSGQAAQIRGNAEYEAASKEAPSKLTANYNAAAGAVKETIGSVIGHSDLEKSGAEQ
ncbi:10885_t:CDS:2, partial [Dentiscutata heterogama]